MCVCVRMCMYVCVALVIHDNILKSRVYTGIEKIKNEFMNL